MILTSETNTTSHTLSSTTLNYNSIVTWDTKMSTSNTN
jgi:hypothetical protein